MHRNERLLQRQTERLVLAERRFRAALESAPDAMVITNEAGVIELANSRTIEMFGHVREGCIGRNLRTLIPEWQPAIPWRPRPVKRPRGPPISRELG